MQGRPNDDRDSQILAGRLGLLFRSTPTILLSAVSASVTTGLLWSTYPHAVLTVWLAAVLVVGAARYVFQARCRPEESNGLHLARWVAAGTFASGMLWGLLCAGLAIWGTPEEFLLVTFVAAGLSSGATVAFSAYLPAFTTYTTALILPLAAACLANENLVIVGNGIFALLYFLIISIIARHNGKVMTRAIELQVDNRILQRSLAQTRIERDHAEVEKWSTMAQLSHELRTPLNAILGFSETMNHEFFGPLAGRYREYAGHIHESGRHLLKLTEDLLDLSRGESGSLAIRDSEIDIGQMILDIVRLMIPEAQKANLQLTGEASPRLPLLRGDETKVRQMLLNLIDNAIKFTPPGGQVYVTTGRTTGGEIYLSVRDSGIGMEPEDIPVALRPLSRLATPLHRSTDGVGLGLPICKRLAELHGATLLVSSKPHSGTTCTIQFPPERSLTGERAAAVA